MSIWQFLIQKIHENLFNGSPVGSGRGTTDFNRHDDKDANAPKMPSAPQKH
jgi:hypothetical protein